jgi:hypothetical protein
MLSSKEIRRRVDVGRAPLRMELVRIAVLVDERDRATAGPEEPGVRNLG